MSMNSVPKLDKIFLRDFDLERFYDGSIIAMSTAHSVHIVNFTAQSEDKISTYTLPVIHLPGCCLRRRQGQASLAPPALIAYICCLVGHAGDHRHSQLS